MKRLINKVSSIYDGIGQSAALLTMDFAVAWTNDEGVFNSEEFKALIEQSLREKRIDEENGFSLSINTVSFILYIRPYYHNGEKLCYICKAETRTELCALIDQSGMLPTKLINALRSDINQIISISHLIADKISDRENSVDYKLLQTQIQCGENILLQYINLAELVNEEELNANREELDITSLCENICEKAQIELNSLKRRIECCWLADSCYVRVNHVKASMMILNLLQNAIKYSPKESDINLEINSDEQNVYISCENTVIAERSDEGAHLGMPVIRKIAAEIGGNCEISQKENSYIFRVKLPRSPRQGLTMSSSKTPYEADDKLIKLFLNSALCN